MHAARRGRGVVRVAGPDTTRLLQFETIPTGKISTVLCNDLIKVSVSSLLYVEASKGVLPLDLGDEVPSDNVDAQGQPTPTTTVLLKAEACCRCLASEQGNAVREPGAE